MNEAFDKGWLPVYTRLKSLEKSRYGSYVKSCESCDFFKPVREKDGSWYEACTCNNVLPSDMCTQENGDEYCMWWQPSSSNEIKAEYEEAKIMELDYMFSTTGLKYEDYS